MTYVKLCGLRSWRDALAFNESGADLAGMILSPGFRRSITSGNARGIRQALRDEIPLCGVFVNAEIGRIVSYTEQGLIDVIQLHGQESNDYIDTLRVHCPLQKIIKAFVVKSPADIEQANHSHADLVLLDGGTGQGDGFDYSLLEGMRRPYVLAGGLNSTNVAAVIRRYHPYGVDTSSGIETDGKKDPKKMTAFVDAVRREDDRQ